MLHIILLVSQKYHCYDIQNLENTGMKSGLQLQLSVGALPVEDFCIAYNTFTRCTALCP